MLNKIIKYFLENKLVTFIIIFGMIAWGMAVAPFDWKSELLPRDPVPVDAIPDIGENQQIVYTEWSGQSPQDIEDQVTYPLTTALLGIPGVKTIRSNSIFGLSSIYIIFDEDVDFYWSRTRILEKLNSLPAGTLPPDVTPALGPDATALGQVYWYTLEGRNPETGEPAGGWDPQELRTIQDYYIKYYITASQGVAEVASIGGYVKEYQVDIDPNAMKAHDVTIGQIANAVKKSNLEIGARTIEINKAEYLVRSLGYIKSLKDLEESVVTTRNNIPIRIKDVAKVAFGPASRRGGLDKSGTEAVGGVVVARYGSNPLEVINNIKEKIKEFEAGLPQKKLADGTISKVTIIPFYDRSGLIHETLGTLETALSHEVLISLIVVIILVMNLRASMLISSLLPIGVLATFISMRVFGVDANIVSLSGIAIAIGVMVDVGIVFTENILRHLEMDENKGAKGKRLQKAIYLASVEVASAVITALATTVVSFLPVFTLQAAEGKLFRPLAFTKTFALLSALIIGIVLIPALAEILFSVRMDKKRTRRVWAVVLTAAGLIFMLVYHVPVAFALVLFGLISLFSEKLDNIRPGLANILTIVITVLALVYFLTEEWLPLGPARSLFTNFLFVAAIIGVVLGLLMAVVHFYPQILKWALNNKWKFLAIPLFTLFMGLMSYFGFAKIFNPVKTVANKAGWEIHKTDSWKWFAETFPALGSEFMPSLDEGTFLLMPTTMPHSGVEENLEVIKYLDLNIEQIPEVDVVVGKWGRVNSALDPAPISMYENIINYKSEYVLGPNGQRIKFKTDKDGYFLLKDGGKFHPDELEELKKVDVSQLVPDKDGKYFRQWRKHIKSPNDIWNEILKHSKFPGLTSAPKLQPIQTRLIMMQTGMRAPMGLKVFGPDLPTIEQTGFELENILKTVPGVKASTVFADRVVGKPYLEIGLNREAIARYGLTITDVQQYISAAIGGKPLTTTVEGRERFPVRVRYAREFRDNPDALKGILIATKSGAQIPLGEIAEILYKRGPQIIKSEDTFLMSYVIFDKEPKISEGEVIENAQKIIRQKIKEGSFTLPAGVSYRFTGNYENQIRASKRLAIVVPISLLIIFLILYFQFSSVTTSMMAFSGIFVALAGGFIMIWLYGQDWFMNFSVAGTNIRDLFQMHTINMSVAVWVGFIALFGIATDDGVIMGTYLTQTFEKEKPGTITDIRTSVLHAGSKRVRPAMMTAATAIIALIPVLSSVGKGSDIMVPMAIPSFGGMLIQVMTMFVVPVLYAMYHERKLKKALKSGKPE